MKKKLPDIAPCRCGEVAQINERLFPRNGTAIISMECRECDIDAFEHYYQTDARERHKAYKRLIVQWNKRVGGKR